MPFAWTYARARMSAATTTATDGRATTAIVSAASRTAVSWFVTKVRIGVATATASAPIEVYFPSH